MIKREELVQIGQIIKPHGLRGEMTFSFTTDVFDEIEPEFFVCEIEGIFVPFYIESLRFKTDEIGMLKFEGIESDEEAKTMIKCQLYMLRSDFPDEMSAQEAEGANFFKGFTIIDPAGKTIGEIVEVDDSSENVLFLVERENGEEIYIPASDDYVTGFDETERIIQMDLPEGLLDL